MTVTPADSGWINLGVALAIGFLIGIERERSKGGGPNRAVAGLRTFTLISLAGALGLWIGGVHVFIATGGIVGLLSIPTLMLGERGLILMTAAAWGAWSVRAFFR